MDDEDKTLAPSAHKLQQAREEGNVSKSPELVGFFVMLAGLALIFFMIPYWVQGFERIFRYIATLFVSTEFDKNDLLTLTLTLAFETFKMLAPIFAALIVMGIAANVGQFGFLLSTKVIKPKLSKINPIKGFKNVFSLKKLLDGFMITLKVLIVFAIGFVVFLTFFGDLPVISLVNLYEQILWFRQKALILIGVLLIIFLTLSIADYMIKRYQYMKNLRMSHKEMKDEVKRYEGNPEIKGRIRAMQQKMARGRMMQEVPKASVVITNPTHYAVAIRYDDEFVEKDYPPVVVAKGIDELAVRIKAVAREHNVRIIENPPLARSLYAMSEVGDFIQKDLYKAVSIVLEQVATLNYAENGDAKLMNTIAKTRQKAMQNQR